MKTIDTDVKRLSKKTLDATIEEIIALKASKKAIEERLGELVKKVESQYKKSPSETEVISGNIYEMKKVPINRGKNNFDPALIRKASEKLSEDITTGLIITKEEVDAAVLNKLIKNGILKASVADKARIDKWTFSSKFSKKASAIIEDNIVTYAK